MKMRDSHVGFFPHFLPRPSSCLKLLVVFLAMSPYVYGQGKDKLILNNDSQLTAAITSVGCDKEKPLSLTAQIDKVQTDSGSASIKVDDIDTLTLSQSSSSLVLSRNGPFSEVPSGVAEAVFKYFHSTGNRVLALPNGVNAGALTSLEAVLIEICKSQQDKPVWRGSAAVSAASTVGTNTQKTLGGSVRVTYERNPSQNNLNHTFTRLDLESSYVSSRKRGQSATVSTQLTYGRLAQDFVLNEKAYLSAFGSLYHNFSTGMRLQKAAGVGILYEVTDGFFIGGDIRGLTQKLYAPSTRFSSLASGVSESYIFVIPKTAITFTQRLEVVFPFKTARAIQGRWASFLIVPATKRLNFTIEYDDDYMRNAPVGYRQNYSKVSLGLGFSFKSSN